MIAKIVFVVKFKVSAGSLSLQTIEFFLKSKVYYQFEYSRTKQPNAITFLSNSGVGWGNTKKTEVYLNFVVEANILLTNLITGLIAILDWLN